MSSRRPPHRYEIPTANAAIRNTMLQHSPGHNLTTSSVLANNNLNTNALLEEIQTLRNKLNYQRSMSSRESQHGRSRSSSARRQVVKPMNWSSVSYDEHGNPQSDEQMVTPEVSPDRYGRTPSCASSALNAPSTVAQSTCGDMPPAAFLSMDEIAAMDVISFGNQVGAVRLDAVKLPPGQTDVVSQQPPALSKTEKQLYISPFSLREPIVVILDQGHVELRRCCTHNSSEVVAHSPTKRNDSRTRSAEVIIASFPYALLVRVEVRRDASLVLRRKDGLEVAISMHSPSKLMALYKLTTLKCRGILPANAAKVCAHVTRSLSSNAVESRVNASVPHQEEQQVAETTSAPSSRRVASSSAERGKRGGVPSTASRSLTSIVPPLRSPSEADLVPNLAPPRVVERVTVKGTAAHKSQTSHSDPAAGDCGVDIALAHCAEDNAIIASREERRAQLRHQIEEMKKKRGQ